MEVSEFFLKLMFILLSAKLLAEAFAYLRLPPVLGEVIAGVLIGPSFLGLVRPDATFYLLAEIGILLLLFEVGLETDVARLVQVGVQSSLVAITGVLVPACAGYWISAHVLGLSSTVSFFVGGTLVATSIGITVRVFDDLNKRHTGTARIVLGAAVLDDIIGVIILAVLYDFAVRGKVNILNSIKLLGFIVAFLIMAPVLARLFVPFMSRLSEISKTKGMIPTLIVSLILLLAVAAHKAGAPEILGSFAAGIALARRFFLPLGLTAENHSRRLVEKIEENMKPVIDLFVPVFFVIVGASIDLKAIDFSSPLFWRTAGLLAVGAVAGKLISGVWVKGDVMSKVATGVAMVPRGEVGLIFAGVGRNNGVFDDMMYAVIVFVVALTTLLGPALLRVMIKEES